MSLSLLFLLGLGLYQAGSQAQKINVLDPLELQARLNSGEKLVTLDDEETIIIGKGDKILVPKGVTLDLNGVSIASQGEFEVEGNVSMDGSSISGNMTLKGTIEYTGRGTSTIEAESGETINIDGGTIKPKKDFGTDEVKIKTTGGDIVFGGSSNVTLTKGSSFDVRNDENRRGIVTVAPGAAVSINGEEDSEAKVKFEGGVMSIEGEGTLNTTNLILDLNPSQTAEFTSDLFLEASGNANLDRSIINAKNHADIRIAGQLNATRSGINTAENSDVILEGGGNMNLSEKSQLIFDSGEVTLDGFLSSHESVTSLSNGAKMNVNTGGFSSSVDDPKSIPKEIHPLAEKVAAQQKAIMEKKVEFEAALEKFGEEDADIIAAYFGFEPASGFFIDNSTVETSSGSTPEKQSFKKRQVLETLPTLFLDSLVVLLDGAEIQNFGQIEFNGVAYVDSTSRIENHSTFNLGGNPFFAEFPKTLNVLGTIENSGDIRNGGGVVNLFETSQLGGNAIESVDGGTVNTDLPAPSVSEPTPEPEPPTTPPAPPAPAPAPAPPTEVRLSITQTDNRVILAWEGTGQLEAATEISGPFEPIADAASPFTASTEGPATFFRLR